MEKYTITQEQRDILDLNINWIKTMREQFFNYDKFNNEAVFRLGQIDRELANMYKDLKFILDLRPE